MPLITTPDLDTVFALAAQGNRPIVERHIASWRRDLQREDLGQLIEQGALIEQGIFAPLPIIGNDGEGITCWIYVRRSRSADVFPDNLAPGPGSPTELVSDSGGGWLKLAIPCDAPRWQS